MKSPYSGSFEFDQDDVPSQQPLPRLARPAAAPAATAGLPPPSPVHAAALPPAPTTLDVSPGPRPLVYIKSDRLAQLSAQLPVNSDRSTLVHGLISAYGLLKGATVEEAVPASLVQLEDFHSREYLSALALHGRLSERQRAAYGLEDDCAPFPGLYEHAALTAGGSLQAAAALCSGAARLAVHLDGGRHHARKARASGFCFVNDVVLAILRLLSSFRRVLYLDVDVHHGDGVEEAFEMTSRVLTMSLHKQAPGFFPGSGRLGARGQGPGRGFALNLPLGDGLRDELFLRAFAKLAGGVAEAFNPDCIVLQCGVDGLARDPLAGSWALTPRGYAAAAAQAAAWGRPLLLLGGGGYDSPSAAVAWAGVLAELVGKAPLPDDIPEHDHFERYGPGFTLSSVSKRLLPHDTTNPAAVMRDCEMLLAELHGAVERPRGSRGSGGGMAGGHLAAGGQQCSKRAKA
ncbi:hypothetical protein ABPG75_002889 [Micractinium tetrahymenae]